MQIWIVVLVFFSLFVCVVYNLETEFEINHQEIYEFLLFLFTGVGKSLVCPLKGKVTNYPKCALIVFNPLKHELVLRVLPGKLY